MMRQNLIGYGLFAVLGLGLAYWASLPTTDRGELGKEWLSIGAKEITQVTFEEPGIKVTMEAKPFGFWITTSEEKKNGEQTETVTESFKAGEAIKDFEDALNPLIALRVVGDSTKQNLNEFGFDDKAGEWSITTKGDKTHRFRIGKRSYGARDLFAVDDGRKQLILIRGQPIELLRNARSRLFEREVMDLDEEEVTKAEIKAGSQVATWLHGDRDQHGFLQWKDDKEGATPQASYRNWMDKITKLKVSRFGNEEEIQAISQVEPFLSVNFFVGGSSKETLVFKKLPAKDEGGQPGYWIESKFLGTPAEISSGRMAPIEKDILGLIGKNQAAK